MNQQTPDSDRLKSEIRQSSITTEDKPAGDSTRLDDDVEAKDFSWDSNKKNENPENYPWPDENESKE
jgi:hypothetical protein